MVGRGPSLESRPDSNALLVFVLLLALCVLFSLHSGKSRHWGLTEYTYSILWVRLLTERKANRGNYGGLGVFLCLPSGTEAVLWTLEIIPASVLVFDVSAFGMSVRKERCVHMPNTTESGRWCRTWILVFCKYIVQKLLFAVKYSSRYSLCGVVQLRPGLALSVLYRPC